MADVNTIPEPIILEPFSAWESEVFEKLGSDKKVIDIDPDVDLLVERLFPDD